MILEARKNEDSRGKGKGMVQKTLDSVMVTRGPKDFTRNAILKAVTIHIATDDQVSIFKRNEFSALTTDSDKDIRSCNQSIISELFSSHAATDNKDRHSEPP